VCTMGRALARLGARLVVPSRSYFDRGLVTLACSVWPKSVASKDARAPLSPCFMATRSTFTSTPRSVATGCFPVTSDGWSRPGQNQKFYVAGALDVRTGKLHTTGAHRKGTALFCDLLRLLAAHYPRARRIHLIVDNYGVHKARAVLRLLDELGNRVVLHFLPLLP
jgi:hypothetical protein